MEHGPSPWVWGEEGKVPEGWLAMSLTKGGEPVWSGPVPEKWEELVESTDFDGWHLEYEKKGLLMAVGVRRASDPKGSLRTELSKK